MSFSRENSNPPAQFIKGLAYLERYPNEELYRLLVEGQIYRHAKKDDFYEEAWQGYEKREPGSVEAYFHALLVAIQQVNKNPELTVDLIQKIHQACTQNVTNVAVVPGKFRAPNARQEIHFSIPKERATVAGLTELLNSIENNFGSSLSSLEAGMIVFSTTSAISIHNIETQRKKYNVNSNEELAKIIYGEMAKLSEYDEIKVKFTYGQEKDSTEDKKIYFYFPPAPELIPALIKKITESYNREIREAKNDDEKIEIIANHVKQYELLHPFHDANGRTFVNVLLNILLMQNGMPPATFDESNVFDAYSTKELVDVIKNAIKNTKQVIEEPNNSLFGFDTKEMTREAAKEKLKEMTEPFKRDLKKIVNSIDASPIPPKESVKEQQSVTSKYPNFFDKPSDALKEALSREESSHLRQQQKKK